MRNIFYVRLFLLFLLIGSCNSVIRGRTWDWGTSDAIWGKISLDSMYVTKTNGFDWLEINIPGYFYADNLDLTINQFKEVKANADQANIKLWSGHLSYGGGTDISTTDEAKRRDAIDRLKNQILLAGEHMGIKYFVLHASYEPISDQERPIRIANAKAAIQELQQVADKIGATVCVESLPRTCLGNTPEELLNLIEGTNAKICFDVNHYSKGTTEHFIDVAKSKIVTLHLSDFEFEGECHWLPGQGKIAWGELLHLLEEAGYEGVLMSEAIKDHENNDQKITSLQLKKSYEKFLEEYELLKDPQKRLEAKIDELKNLYFPGDLSYEDVFLAGSDPGYYKTEVFDHFQAIYNQAIKATNNFDQLRIDLSNAMENLLNSANGLFEGYFWIKSSSEYFIDKNPPLDMAMYSDNSGQLRWKSFEPSLQFLFKVELIDDKYYIRNMYDDTYIGANAVNSQPIPMTDLAQYEQFLSGYGLYGMVKLFNGVNKSGYHMLGHGSGNGTEGNIVQYDSYGVKSASSWYMKEVDSGTVADLLANKKPLVLGDIIEIIKNKEFYTDVVFGFKKEDIILLENGYNEYLKDPSSDISIKNIVDLYNDIISRRIQIEEGKIYQILNLYRTGSYMASNSIDYAYQGMGAAIKDEENLGTYWTFIKEGDAWKLKNIQRDAFLGPTTATSDYVLFSNNNPGYYEISVSDKQPTALIRCNNSTASSSEYSHLDTQGYNLLAWNSTSDASKWYIKEVEFDDKITDLYLDLAKKIYNNRVTAGWPGNYEEDDMSGLISVYEVYIETPNDNNKKNIVNACKLLTMTKKRVGFDCSKYYRLINVNRKVNDRRIALSYNQTSTIAGEITEGNNNVTDVDMLWQIIPNENNNGYLIKSANGKYLRDCVNEEFVGTTTSINEASEYFFSLTETGNWWIRDAKKDFAPLHANVDGMIMGYNDQFSSWILEPINKILIDTKGEDYATRYFPFAISLNNLEDQNVMAFWGTSVSKDNSILYLKQWESKTLSEQQPIIFKRIEYSSEPIVLEIIDKGEVPEDNILSGTLLPTEVDENTFVLGVGSKGIGFYRVSLDDNVIRSNRAYLRLSEDASFVDGIKASFDGVETNIIQNKVDTGEGMIIYDLQGVKMKNLSKGIYVTSDGNKIIQNK